jgi:hypothetical protein
METMVGQRKLKNGTTVDAACKGSLSVCHRFANLGLCSSLSVTVDRQIFTSMWTVSHNNCSTYFFGAFANSRKATSFVMAVCRPARNNLAPTGRIFMKFCIWGVFENLSRKFKFHKIGHKYKGVLYIKTNVRFWSFLLRMRNVSNESWRENQNIWRSIKLFLNRSV